MNHNPEKCPFCLGSGVILQLGIRYDPCTSKEEIPKCSMCIGTGFVYVIMPTIEYPNTAVVCQIANIIQIA